MDGTLNLPTNVLIATIRKYRDQLSERYEWIKNYGTNELISLSSQQQTVIDTEPSVGCAMIKPRPTRIIPLKSYRDRIKFDNVVVSV